ncbi:SpoIIE family protein phosphatase [Streptomyces yangpuensis]|uniref:SpoIIE family protein phosphatase n=1 Tax=Streptomyces yangpuensis TaxID=1648182 RepID=UPI0035DB067B
MSGGGEGGLADAGSRPEDLRPRDGADDPLHEVHEAPDEVHEARDDAHEGPGEGEGPGEVADAPDEAHEAWDDAHEAFRDADDALDEALTGTIRRTGASAGGVHLWAGPEHTRLALVVLCGVPTEVAWPWHRISPADSNPVSDAVREDRLVWIGSQEDLAHDYPQAAVRLPYEFCLAAAPLRGRRGSHGALLLVWPAGRDRTPTPREQRHIVAAARRIARPLDEPAGLPAVPERPRVIPATSFRAYAGRPAQAAADWAERLPEGALALDLEGRITFVDGTAAALLGRTSGELLGTWPWQSLPWLDAPLVEDRYRSAVLSREPVEFTALRPPDVPLRFQLYPDSSGISVRVTRAARHEETPPSGGPTGTSVPHTGRIHQLLHLAAAMTETVTVRDVVELVAHQVLPAFGADALVLSAADAGRLRITGYHGYDPRIIERLDGLPLDTGLTPAGQVLADGVPAFFGDRAAMARAHPGATQVSGKEAWAFLPLTISGRPVGCCILSYERPHTFTADERAVLTSLAGLIAQALDRARLHDAAHDLAHGLQQALLPHTLPVVPGLEATARYLPAGHGMDIGGDFYDVIALDATNVAAVIGDVQGHNVAAAALMGQVRTAIRAAAGGPPGAVLARTGRLLSGLDTDLLVSCLYVHIDLASRCATLSSAGHPPPLVHAPGSRPQRVEVDPWPLLGIDTGTPCPVTRLELAPGTLLTLYTDGLVEKPTAAGIDAERGTDDVAAVLAEHDGADLDDIVEALLRGIGAPSGHTDDIALLLLRL